MKFCILVACFAVAISANTQQEWDLFKESHKKAYRSLIEERLRYQIFSDNLDKINNHNAKFAKGETTYTMGVNQFADMTEEEFMDMFKHSLKPLEVTKTHEKTEETPLEKDWRIEGAVTPVKDQKTCGSCWAFSATGALEGQYQIKNNKTVSLSEQNLIDCTQRYANEGCRGGYMENSFSYVRDFGIMTEDAYPYENRQKKCRYNESASVLKASGHVGIAKNREEDLMNAVGTVGPISVTIDASLFMSFYSSGIYNDFVCSSKALNHGVLAVGYGNEKGTDYWIVKNSWGARWGEKGYIRMRRGKNMCGIATRASYPTLLI
ncbi:unnamed protein product [Brassicogethes aeneus]|uniref:Cathepsin L n=1 Tax=Brassicogethes aeneus TaxID=1431903 RepID=A0A9P0AQE1_BRAAE|nr:unnamed protein product [Brassicogethes aeneus]